MRITLGLLLLLGCTSARADFILSTGLAVGTPLDSNEKAANGERVLDASAGGGLQLGAEWNILPFMSFVVTGGYRARTGEVQYQNETASVADLDATIWQLHVDTGARLRFINLKRFRTYVGGGLTVGYFGALFDEDDFEETVGNKTGFEESESKPYTGTYADAGIEYILNKKSALRLFGKYTKFKTGEFENLGKERLTLDYAVFGIQYMYYVDL